MIVQINTDKTIVWDERHTDHFTGLIKDELDRFSDDVSRIEVHLSDENGSKEGPNDIRCLMEVRIEGKQPTAVSDQTDSIEKSVDGALMKIKTILEKNTH